MELISTNKNERFMSLLNTFMSVISEKERLAFAEFMKGILENSTNTIVTIKLIITIVIQNDRRFARRISESDSDDEFFEKAISISKEYEFVRRVLEFIYMKCPDLKHIDLDDTSDLVLFIGKVQSGKSDLLRCIGLYYLLIRKQNVILVLLGLTGHALQFNNGLKLFSKQFSDYMNLHHFKVDEITCLYTGDVKNDLVIPEEFEERMANKTCFNSCIANKVQLKRVQEIVKDDYVLLIDEADQVNYAQKAEYTKELVEIRKDKKVYAITATGFEIMLVEEDLKVDKIFSLTAPPNYKGVPHIIMEEIEKKDDFEKYYTNLKKKPIFKKEMYNCESDHPIISLHVSEIKKENQDVIFKKIRKYGFTVIKYNGDGIELYSPVLKGEKTITLHSGRASQNCKGVHVFHNCGIQEVLQYLKENGGAELFPHIVIISGRLANRGINFVSSDFKWHLSHEYYLPSSLSNCSNLLQGARLCGVYNDSIPLVLHASKNTIIKIQKSYHLQEELIQRIRNEENTEQIVKEALKNFCINMGKMPKGKLSKSYVKRTRPWAVTTGDDGHMENIDSFTVYDKVCSKVKTIDDLVRSLMENIDKNEETEPIKLIRFLVSGRKTKRETQQACGNQSCTNHNKWGTHRNYHIVDVSGDYVELCKSTMTQLQEKLPQTYLQKILI